jgi:hypothetical protein
VFGQGGHQRGRRSVGVFPAEQVDGAAASDDVRDVSCGPDRAGDAAAADVGLEEQVEGLVDGGDGVAGGPVVAVEGAVEEAVPVGGGVGVFAEDLAGFGGRQGSGHPVEDVVEGAAGEGGCVKVALEDFGGFGGVEAGGTVTAAGVDGAADGAGGECFGSAFGDHGVDAPLHGVPHEFRESWGEAERVEHCTRPVVGAAVGDGQEQVVDLGEGDEGGAGGGEEGRGEQV